MPMTTTGAGVPVVLGPVAPAGAAFAVVAHPSCCRSDAANTIPCAAGDGIRWWRDLVTGTWHEQATSGARLILRDAGGGKWFAEGDTGRFHPTVSGLPRVGVTLGAAARGTANGFFPMMLSTGSDGRELRWNDSVRRLSMITNNGGFTLIESAATDLGVDFRAVATCSGTTVLYRDGTSVASLADTSLVASMSALNIGGRGAANSWIGRIYAAAVYSSALDASGVIALDTWIRGYMP